MQNKFKILSFCAVLTALFFGLPLWLKWETVAQSRSFLTIDDIAFTALDGLIATIISLAFALATPKVARVLVFVSCLAMTVLLYANYEFIYVFDKALEFNQAGFLLNPTFVLGSAVHLRFPVQLVAAIGLAYAASLLLPRVNKWMLVSSLAIALVAAIIVNSNFSKQHATTTWRTSSLLVQNYQNLKELLFPDAKAAPVSEEMLKRVNKAIQFQTGGEPYFEGRLDRPNILLLVLESVSGAYLPSFAQWHGLESEVKMPNLDDISSNGLKYARFFAHQRSTTRGTYALLCSDMPEFSNGKPKLEALGLEGKRKRCLPAELKELGYTTSYLQSAPLSFSNKDLSLPLIGFDAVSGANSFSEGEKGSAWGVDDGVLFKRVFDEVQKLHMSHSPWFMTVLNVGTHHPFDIVPEDFQGAETPKVRAFEYLDKALGDFFQKLEDNGLLDDTLILITSDESGGLVGTAPAEVQQVARNWSLFSAIHPAIPANTVRETFGHIDFAPTIFDLIGHKPEMVLTGQSALRKPEHDRPVYLYNNLGGELSILRSNALVTCSTKTEKCFQLATPDAKLGASLETSVPVSADEMYAALQLNNPSTTVSTTSVAPLQVEMASDPSNAQLVFCCTYTDISKGDEVAVKIAGKSVAGSPNSLILEVVSSRDGVFTEHFRREASPDDSGEFQFNLGFSANKDLFSVEVRLRSSHQTTVELSAAEFIVRH